MAKFSNIPDYTCLKYSTSLALEAVLRRGEFTLGINTFIFEKIFLA